MTRPRPVLTRQSAWTLGVVLWVAGGLMLWDDHLRVLWERGRRWGRS